MHRLRQLGASEAFDSESEETRASRCPGPDRRHHRVIRLLSGHSRPLPGSRETLVFFFVGLSGIATALSAVYIAIGLAESSKTSKLAKTLDYQTRWNDVGLRPARRALRELVRDESDFRALAERIDTEEELSDSVVDALNFLEELALAIDMGIVDEALLLRLHRTTVLRWRQALVPWIDRVRSSYPRAYVEFEELARRWGSTPSVDVQS